MQIRRANDDDAAAICEVVIASITELCLADHHSDPRILDLWLANKTPETVAGWIKSPTNTNLVAVDDVGVMAAGCVTAAGFIVLNYVAPSHRFQGVSSAMLTEIEIIARGFGHASCSLESTSTAHRFYKRHHYFDVGEPQSKFGLTMFPMTKAI